MSAFEIKIVAPELASALNRLADAIAGQGQLPLTGTAEFVPTSELAKEPAKAEEPKTTARKSKPAAEEKTADAAGDAEPAEDTSKSSTTQNDEPQSEPETGDGPVAHDDDAAVTEITVEALGKAITDAVAAGHRNEVVAILKSFGAKRGGEVPEGDRADCFAQIDNLSNKKKKG